MRSSASGGGFQKERVVLLLALADGLVDHRRDLVYLLASMGYGAGVDLDRVIEVSRELELEHGATLNSRFFRYASSLV